MESCSVLIVGGGPAGSSCAWALRGSGLDVLVVDRARFPRDKVCGGWITEQVVEELELDLHDYSQGRTVQAITGFRVGLLGGHAHQFDYPGPVSYAIRRCEFDEYLLRRSGARVREGFAVDTIHHDGTGWIVNNEIRTQVLVGAGGHFCPVARRLGGHTPGEPVLAQEIEFPLDNGQRVGCRVDPYVPELYFCHDLRGYGWAIRKHDMLNVGLGRVDRESLPQHVREFAQYLRRIGRIDFDLREHFPGHAYFLFGYSTRPLHDDAVLLIGDSAGLAFEHSGEGIRTAVESGLLAAQAILAAEGDYSRARLEPYAAAIRGRFVAESRLMQVAKRLPSALRAQLGRWLLHKPGFVRDVVLDDWFLHADTAPLRLQFPKRTKAPVPPLAAAS